MRTTNLLTFLTASLQRKLMIALMILVSIVLGAVGIYLLHSRQQSASAELEEHSAHITNLLSKTLAVPLWNIDLKSIQDQLDVVMVDPRALFVALYEQGHDQPMASKKRDGVTISGVEQSASVIYVRDQPPSTVELGKVRLVYSRDNMYRELEHTRMLILAVILFLLASISAATYFLLRRMVQKPVGKLLAMTHRIADGDFAARISVSSRDEIGHLSDNFNSMTDKLEQTMDRLGRSEEKYRSIYENAAEGIFQSALEGGFISVNPAMARIHGYESPEKMVESITSIREQLYVNPEDRVLYKNILEDRGRVENFEAQVHKKDGTVIWISTNAHVVKDATGKILYFEGVVKDVTKRKKAEAELHRLNETLEARVSERTRELEYSRGEALGMMLEAEKERERAKEALEKLRESSEQLHVLSKAVEQSPSSVMITDPKGCIEYVNLKFTLVTGYIPEEVLGHNQRMLGSGAQDEGIYRGIWETIGSGEEWHGELRNKKKNDEHYWEQVSVSAIRNEAGEILNFLWMGEDITAQKRMHEELEHRIKDLERFTSLTVDREMRMIELKQEINTLREQMSEEEKYKIVV